MALTDNLNALWELGEASGTRNDSHGTNHLTDNATVTQQTGLVGNCAEFTAANGEYLSLADNASISTGDIDWSFWCWVRFTTVGNVDSNTQRIAGQVETTGNQVSWYLDLYTNGTNNPRFRFSASPDGSAQTNMFDTVFGVVPATTWILVVVWHDATANTINMSVNGDPTATSIAHAGGTLNSTGPFTLGTIFIGGAPEGNAAKLNGRLDQVGFRKQIPTTTELAELYNSGAGLSYAAMGGAPFMPKSDRIGMTSAVRRSAFY